MSIDLSVSENERLKEQDSIQCLRYSNSNSNSSLRNALVIGYSKKVTLFDVMNQKVIKTLRLSKYDSQGISEQNQLNSNGLSLTALAVNQRLGRDHVAVGGKYGHLRIISLTSEISGAPSVDNKIQDITELSFSRFKQSLLAGSSESGTIALWDANAVKRTLSFLEHRAPATGLAFSPMNEMLLASSGLDKRCFCYDVSSGKTAATIKTSEPLTCLDFRNDGTTISLGTSKGKILVYDLRSSKAPFQVLDPHPGSAVKCLLYQVGHDGKSMHKNRSSSSLLKQTSKKNMLAEVCKENMPVEFSSDSISTTIASPSKFQNSHISQNVTPASVRFSPMARDDSQDQIFSPLGAANASNDSNLKAVNNNSRNTSNMSNYSRLSNESVFSPLRENSSNMSDNDFVTNHGESFLPTTPSPLIQNGSKSFQSPLPIIQEMVYEGNSSISSKTETQPLTIRQKVVPDSSTNDESYGTSNYRKTTNPELSISIKNKETDLLSTTRTTHPIIPADKEDVAYNHMSDTNPKLIQPSKSRVVEPEFGLRDSGDNTSMYQDKNNLGKTENFNSILKEDVLINPTFQQPASLSRPERQKVSATLPDLDNTSNNIPNSLPDEKHSGVNADSESTNGEKAGPSDIKAMMIAFPEALDNTPFKTSIRNSYSKEHPQNDTNIKSAEDHKRTQKFQQDYLKSVVTECMHDFTSEVRKQLWHIEWDMTKNFQRLKEENDQQQEGFSKMYENMMLENQRLREENEALKRSRPYFENKWNN